MPSVLFVCTANRFRSPLAAAFFREAIGVSTGSDWVIDSAGTWTSTGLPALPEVLLIARKYGLELARHRSKPVTDAMLSAHDLILVMEAGHKEALQVEFPASSDRVHLLSWVAERRNYDIPDLIDSVDSMMEVGENLHDLIQTGFRNICDLATHLHGNREKSNRN